MRSFEKRPSASPISQEPNSLESQEKLSEVVDEVKKHKSFIDVIQELVNSKVNESRLPTKEGLGYESTVGIYGGKLVHDETGKMVYDTRGFWSKIDQWGDRILRSFDEHYAKKPLQMFLRRPGSFLKLLPFIVDAKRYRGTPIQTMENVKRLGLEEYYAPHPWGIGIKDPALFSHAIGLQDIFRQDTIQHPAIANIDRFIALASAVEYMKKLHDTAGGIGEAVTAIFLFTKIDENEVSNPILLIPTEIYNPEKNISEIEQKATDLLDLFANVATEEYRRTQDWESVRKTFTVILEHYQDTNVTDMVASYVQRGRLTLPDKTHELDSSYSTTHQFVRPAFAAHNVQRISVKNSEITSRIRQEIINVCRQYSETRS